MSRLSSFIPVKNLSDLRETGVYPRRPVTVHAENLSQNYCDGINDNNNHWQSTRTNTWSGSR